MSKRMSRTVGLTRLGPPRRAASYRPNKEIVIGVIAGSERKHRNVNWSEFRKKHGLYEKRMPSMVGAWAKKNVAIPKVKAAIDQHHLEVMKAVARKHAAGETGERDG
jgi:hypothetical protein